MKIDEPRVTKGAEAGSSPTPAPTPPTPSDSALARLIPPSGRAYGLLAVAGDGRHLVATPKPDPTTADGYLRLAAHVLVESKKMGFRTVGVSSPVDGEGRTAAAVNLAVCLGRARGREGRVLLIDADSRKRTLSRLFCGSEEARREGSRARHPMLVGTALDGVDLMTAPVEEDGLTLTTPDAWAATLAEMAAAYPHVVVDCPPVLDDPEGLVLREVVERMVLVVRAGRPKAEVERAIGSHRDRVLAVVVQGGVDAPVVETA